MKRFNINDFVEYKDKYNDRFFKIEKNYKDGNILELHPLLGGGLVYKIDEIEASDIRHLTENEIIEIFKKDIEYYYESSTGLKVENVIKLTGSRFIDDYLIFDITAITEDAEDNAGYIIYKKYYMANGYEQIGHGKTFIESILNAICNETQKDNKDDWDAEYLQKHITKMLGVN